MSGPGAAAGSIPLPGGLDWSASAAFGLRFRVPAPQQLAAGSRMVGPRRPGAATAASAAAEPGLARLAEEMPISSSAFLTRPLSPEEEKVQNSSRIFL